MEYINTLVGTGAWLVLLVEFMILFVLTLQMVTRTAKVINDAYGKNFKLGKLEPWSLKDLAIMIMPLLIVHSYFYKEQALNNMVFTVIIFGEHMVPIVATIILIEQLIHRVILKREGSLDTQGPLIKHSTVGLLVFVNITMVLELLLFVLMIVMSAIV